MLLAIDTSTTWASLAVFDSGTVLAEEGWRAERHGDEIFPAIERVLARAGGSIASVDRVATAIGPGSFTGVRLGIATAQGIARGSGARVAGVPTLDAVAYAHARTGRRICAVLPAGRGEVFAALYDRRAGNWARRTPIFVATPDELARRVSAPTLFAGEIGDSTLEALRGSLGERASFVRPADAPRRAAYVAELGWQAIEDGHAMTPAELEPIYLRPPAVRGRSGELIEAGDRELEPPSALSMSLRSQGTLPLAPKATRSSRMR